MDPIPEGVLNALEEARDSGETNMLVRTAVIEIADWMGYEDAAAWLKENKARYMEALKAMGERRAQRMKPQP